METEVELGLAERVTIWLSRLTPRLMGKINLRLLRWTGGRVGASARGIPIGVLTTTGRVSGEPRSVPLMYVEREGHWLVLAVNSGLDAPPGWLRNLRADPTAVFEPAGRRVEVRGRVLTPDEHAELWPWLVGINPVWAGFQSRTERRLEVVELAAL